MTSDAVTSDPAAVPTSGQPTRPQVCSPSGDDGATMTCPVCRSSFTRSGRKLFCGDACRRLAWKRRHQSPAVPIVVAPPGRPRRPLTIYECTACGSRALGEQRCPDCGTFTSRVGLGGACPHCNEPVAVADLGLAEPVTTPLHPNRGRS